MIRGRSIHLVPSCANVTANIKMPSEIPAASSVRSSDNLLGAGLLVCAAVVLTLESGIIRWIGQDAGVSQVIFFRALAQFVVIFCWAGFRGAMPVLATGRLGLHIARGLISLGAWGLFYSIIQRLDLALSTVLTFATPLFVVVLAGPVLGEKVRLVSWIATIIGFAGIALAAGVGGSAFQVEVALGLLAALLASGLIFINRLLSQTEDTLTIMTYIGVFVLAVSAPLAMMNWAPISFAIGAWLLAAGMLGAFGMIFSIEAYARSETALLAPIPYVRIVFAMILGFFAFGEVPKFHELAGAAIVVTCALVATRAR